MAKIRYSRASHNFRGIRSTKTGGSCLRCGRSEIFDRSAMAVWVRLESNVAPPREDKVSDWSKNAVQRLQSKKEEERIKNEITLQMGNLLNQQSSQRWEELRNEFVRMAAELDSEPGMSGALSCDDSKPNALSIQNTITRKSVDITFDKESHCIATNDRFGRTYHIAVMPDTLETCFLAATTRGIERTGRTITPSEIARNILDELLGIA